MRSETRTELRRNVSRSHRRYLQGHLDIPNFFADVGNADHISVWPAYHDGRRRGFKQSKGDGKRVLRAQISPECNSASYNPAQISPNQLWSHKPSVATKSHLYASTTPNSTFVCQLGVILFFVVQGNPERHRHSATKCIRCCH
jgi:hypothetical protein